MSLLLSYGPVVEKENRSAKPNHSLEYNIGVIAAYTPSLKPLLSHALNLSTNPCKSSNPYIDRPVHAADSNKPKRRGYLMQASQDDGVDCELGHISPHEHSTTARGGQSVESKENVTTGSYDFVAGAQDVMLTIRWRVLGSPG